MFEKKDYIKVRGIGMIKCKPELDVGDVRLICETASGLPFVKPEGEDAKTEYLPELVEYSFVAALLAVATDYDLSENDLWHDMHYTNLVQKLYVYYSEYYDEMYTGTMCRISTMAESIKPLNEEAIFNGVAKSLENVDIGDILNVAHTISEMDAQEIVKAALTTDAP